MAKSPLRCLRGFHLNREKSKVTDWLYVVLAFAAAVAAFLSVLIFQGQLIEARKATELLQRQLKITQAAIISVDVLMKYPNRFLRVRVYNSGHVIAHKFWARFKITRKTLPELKPIGNPVEKVIDPSAVGPGENGTLWPIYEIEGLGKEEWDAMMRVEQTVEVESRFAYDNGFGKLEDGQITCKSVLFSSFTAKDGHILPNMGENFVSCDETRVRFKDAIASRKAAEIEAKKQRAAKPN